MSASSSVVSVVLAPVNVGKTDLPLRPAPEDRGPVPPLDFPVFPASSASSSTLPPTFRLLDGPPYANGAPHLGHVLNKHLKDAVARAHAAQGKEVQWRPGWDCHGLPLELALERQGVPRHPVGSFVSRARAHAQTHVDAQAQVFEGQGWMAQWERPWTTMDAAQQAATLRVFGRLVESGRVQVRHCPVPWCPQCQSTVAGAEQEDKEVSVVSAVVPFSLASPVPGFTGPQVLLSWTSTPWTVPLNQLLAVDPAARFVPLVRPQAVGVAWVSASTAARWCHELGATVAEGECLGSELAGLAYRTPWSRGVVVADAQALPDAGTGVLHAVFGLAEVDSRLVETHGLEKPHHLTPDGRVQGSPQLAQNGLLAGPDASGPVLDALASDAWFKPMTATSTHPHCWRHKVPLLTRASRQVFVVLDDQVRSRAAAMVAGMAFTPESARARLVSAMSNRPDWCVSRQRSWGVPLALFLDRSTGQPHARASKWMNRVAEEVAQRGVEAWWDEPSTRWLDHPGQLDALERVDDVLDVWFDSGCVPQHLGSADVVVEGVDQHRGWFQACVWVAAALGDPSPFRRVVSHGFVVDAHRVKLSKSTGGDGAARGRGSVPGWADLPTDVTRLWALAGGEGMDKAWSEETVRQAQSGYARLRGVLRFLVANALPGPPPGPSLSLTAWDVHWVESTQRSAAQALDCLARGYSGQAVSQLLDFAEHFSSQALGSWKDRLYCAPAHTEERKALDLALKACLVAWLHVLSALTPRLAREACGFVDAATLPWSCAEGCTVGSAASCTQPALFPARAQVEQVLAVRQALGPANETLSQRKVGPMLRMVTWSAAPAWPGQALADALDVAHLAGPGLDAEWVWVDVPGVGRVGVAPSPCPTCPRCRRAQPSMLTGACLPCVRRSVPVA